MEEQQYPPMEYGGYGMAPQQMINPSQADLVEKITPRKLAEEIEHKLRGEVFHFKKEVWYRPKDSKPFLNEEGIWRIISVVTSYVNDNTIYSNLSQEEISALMVKLSRQLIGLLQIKYKEFKIDKAYLTTVKNIVMTSTFLALLRAKGGVERRLLSKSITEQIISKQQQPEQNKGLFGLPKLFK